ncbi:MAG: glycosyltransferase family 2 protein, partial [Acetivibrio ethanolgignens]
ILSVIVPVYNAAKTINRCVDSIMNQTFRDFELILVNDGSQDESLKICNTICSKYDNVQLVDRPNGGVSSARNAGINASKGEYLTFVDSDDFLDTHCFEYYFENNKSFDFYIQGYRIYTDRGNTISRRLPDNINNIVELLEYTEAHNLINCPWAKLFKRDIIIQNQIYFNHELSYGEDHQFVLEYLLHVNTMCCSCSCGYNYVQGDNESLTKKLIPAHAYGLYINCVEQVYDKFKSTFSEQLFSIERICNRRIFYNVVNYATQCSRHQKGIEEFRELKTMLNGFMDLKTVGLDARQSFKVWFIRVIEPKILFGILKLVYR